ncbi:hypothetical protein KJ766_00810 [Patescibacteria group bacterium]|nr:hypothetical protein [Patescibacteria group bacterium]
MNNMNEGGMTKVELLITAGVVGVLGLLAIFSISSARAGTRDAVRLSDVRQVQIGLELYFNKTNSYPESLEKIALGRPSTYCLDASGFSAACSGTQNSIFLESISAPPASGLKGLSGCSDLKDAYCYQSNGGEFGIEFELEKNYPLLNAQKGINCFTQSGFKEGSCQF